MAAPAPLSGRNITLSRSAGTVEIAGQIVAAESGSPLGEVFVLFQRLNQATGSYEYAGLALSDAAGAYSGVLPPGTYRVSFRPGFSDDSSSARYLGATFGSDLALAGGESGRADAALVLGGTIGGTVTGAGGPLAGVMVQAFDVATGALAGEGLTGDDGAYRTSGLPVGSYRLRFITYISSSAATRAYAGTTRAEPVVLGGAADVAGIDARLSLGGAIAGAVTGAGGAPLADVLVLGIDTRGTADAGDDELGGLALTGADGAYTVPGLATGSYVVAFITELTGNPAVAAYFDKYYSDTTSFDAAARVPVTAGATVKSVDAALTLGGQIRGRVADETSGAALDGVLVEVYAASDRATLVAFAITDERGEYATTSLATGASYIVRFDPIVGGGAGAYAAEYYSNAPAPGDAQPIDVSSTAPVTGIDAGLALQP